MIRFLLRFVVSYYGDERFGQVFMFLSGLG